jgi:hypothetical protein
MNCHVELLWFSDCPNHPVARQMLAGAIDRLAPGTKIEEVRNGNLRRKRGG